MDAFLESLDPDPVAQFVVWFDEARGAGLWEPEAAALATATADGAPSVRMVLLRRWDERGFCFFTNRESRKGVELAVNPRAALALHWGPPLERQVRIEGAVEEVGAAESAAYFSTRPRGSRLGAWASPQSHPLADRDELERRLREVEERFADDEDPPLPPFWGGYRVVPAAVELWQNGRNRLHDRVRYERDGATWRRTRLAP